MVNSLLIIQIICLLTVFLFAAVQDIKTKLVSDIIWIIGFILQSIIHIIVIHFSDEQLYTWGNIGLNIIIAGIIIVVFYLPKLFGGKLIMEMADLFAIFIFSYSIPGYYSWINVSSSGNFIPIPIIILFNSLICMCLYVIYQILYNIYSDKEERTHLRSIEYPMIVFFLVGIVITILFGSFLLTI